MNCTKNSHIPKTKQKKNLDPTVKKKQQQKKTLILCSVLRKGEGEETILNSCEEASKTIQYEKGKQSRAKSLVN